MIQFGANFSTLGIPEIGLSPTITIRDTSDGSIIINAAIMSEIGGGAYKYNFSNDITKKYSIIFDGGIDTLDSRYLTAWSERAKAENDVSGLNGDPMRGTDSVPTDPLLTNDSRLDNLDATISSRSSLTEIFNYAIENNLSFKKVLTIMLSSLGGLSDGAGTTLQHFRNNADNLDRITAQVSSEGNRIIISYDFSDL